MRNDAWFGGKTPWDKVTMRILTQDAARVAALLSGDVARDRERADRRRREAEGRQEARHLPRRVRPADVRAHGQRPHDHAGCHRQERQAARTQSAQGPAGAQGVVEDDQPAGHRRAGDGGPGDSFGPAGAGLPVRRVEESQGRALRPGRGEEAARRGGLPGRLRRHAARDQQPLRERRQDRAGDRADVDAGWRGDQGRRHAVGDVLPAGHGVEVQRPAGRAGAPAPASRRRR